MQIQDMIILQLPDGFRLAPRGALNSEETQLHCHSINSSQANNVRGDIHSTTTRVYAFTQLQVQYAYIKLNILVISGSVAWNRDSSGS
jgi:hypothetical protein